MSAVGLQAAVPAAVAVPTRGRGALCVGLLLLLLLAVVSLASSASRLSSTSARKIFRQSSAIDAAKLQSDAIPPPSPPVILATATQRPTRSVHSGSSGGSGGESNNPILARLHAMAAAQAAASTSSSTSPSAARFGVSNGSDQYLSPSRVRQLQRQYRGRKFVFPLLDQGPNNQFLQFRVAVAKARQLNRTLVLPIWLPHNPRFQHFHPGAPATPSRDKYLEQLWYPFETAFAADALSSYVRTVPLRVFRALSGGRVERCIAPHAGGFETYLRLSRLKCATLDGGGDGSSSSAHVRFLGYHLFDQKLGTRDKYFEYVRPSGSVMEHADALSRDIFFAADNAKSRGGGDGDGIRDKLASLRFFAVHLRVADAHWERSDCAHSIGGIPVPSVSCGDAQRAMNETTIARQLVSALRRARANEPGLSEVYLATNMGCTDARVATIGAALERAHARLVCSQPALLQRASHDNFVASLIEQELCARASGFVGSKYSTWTDTVRGMRSQRGRSAQTSSFEDLWSQGSQ